MNTTTTADTGRSAFGIGAELRAGYAQIGGGVTLYYVAAGSGPLVVLLPFCCSASRSSSSVGARRSHRW